LYPYDDCGGNYLILDNALKDCTGCVFPHGEDGYDKVIAFIVEKNRIKSGAKKTI
jgi:hypothetical protein